MKAFEHFLDILGFLSAIAYTLVPGIFIYQLRHKVLIKERLSIIAILSLYLNGLIYFIRSIVYNEKEELDVRDFCNLIGAQLGLVYLFFYLKNIYYETKIKIFIVSSLIIILLSIGIILIENFIGQNELLMKIVEYVGVLFNILEYLPMGFDLIFLIKNKISEKFTLFGAFFGLINTIIWLIWAIYNLTNNKKKIHSLIANIFGLLLCILQISIFFIFRKEEEIEEEQNNDEEEKLNNNITNKNELNVKDKKEEKGNSDIIEQFI